MSKNKKPSEEYDVISDGRSESNKHRAWWDIGLKPTTWFFSNVSTIALTLIGAILYYLYDQVDNIRSNMYSQYPEFYNKIDDMHKELRNYEHRITILETKISERENNKEIKK